MAPIARVAGRDNARQVGGTSAGVALGPLRHGDAGGVLFRLGIPTTSLSDADQRDVWACRLGPKAWAAQEIRLGLDEQTLTAGVDRAQRTAWPSSLVALVTH